MWKYVSRRIRDTFERNANHHFEYYKTTGIPHQYDNKNNYPCRSINSKCCGDSSQRENDTNRNGHNFGHLNRSWIGAITWSSALIVGWYASKLLHIKYKYKQNLNNCPTVKNLISIVHPFLTSIKKEPLHSDSKLKEIIEQFTPSVYLISNDHEPLGKSNSSFGSNSDKESSSDLSNVLNSIENRLGLAALEGGKPEDGLNLLRSAANRNHAPAIYNLALCYELGLGVNVDEKIAVKFYRSAASLEHPGALYNLALYYGQGRGGLNRDTTMATRLLRLAAVKGQQDAIDAIKNLEINDPSNQTKYEETDRYGITDDCKIYAHTHNIPTHTALFVENVNFHHNVY